MDHLDSIWNTLATFIFVMVFILEIIFTLRMSQKLCIKMMTRFSAEIKSIFKGNGLPLAKSEHGCSSFVRYTSFFLGSFIGIIFTGIFVGAFMLFAVSEWFEAINLTIFPSFFSSVFEWIVLVTSGIILFFMGLYGSKLVSFYINKIPSPYSHNFARIASLGLLTFFISMSITKIGSAVQFINLSIFIVTLSLFIAMIPTVLKSMNVSPNFKSLLNRIV